MWTGVCPALGITLNPGYRMTDDSPSLDRKVPTLGYTKSNVAILSQRANQIKSNATVGELFKVARWLRKITKQKGKP